MPADPSLPDSRPLFRLIGQTRRLLRSAWVLTGLGLTVGLLLAALVTMTLLDLFVPLEPVTLPFFRTVVALDPLVRTLALLLIVVPAGLAFLHGVVRPLLRRLGPTQVARRIESHLPGIHNRLVSAIDLESRQRAATTSPVFLRRLLTEALDRVRGFRPFTVVDRKSLLRAGLFAAASCAACLLVGVAFADYLPTTLRRIFNPLADVPPASSVAYAVRPGTADVLREEEIPFTAEVTRGDPAELRLELYGDRGTVHKFDLKPDRTSPNKWKAAVDAGSLGKGFENGFRYRVYGGRTWSPQYAITLVDRPVLASVQKAVHYPEYMRLPEPVAIPPDAVEVTGPEGGQVEVIVQAQGQVSEGEIQLLAPDVKRIPPDRQQERVWFEERTPVGATCFPDWDWQQADKRPTHVDPAGFGVHGHWFQGDPVGQVVGQGDVLFAYVRLTAGQLPETLLLEWHDGDDRKGWEHRAYWGADRIKEGLANTASRFAAGELPAAGEWVRLEVPAAKVGLEGKTIRGMAFKLYGGQAQWGRAGTVQLQEPGVRVLEPRYPLVQNGDVWSGKFPLVGKGLFRAELRSRAGHPNKPMKELKYLALPDKDPYVALDRQNAELVLGKPAPVPLTVSAFDDYGLDEITLLVRPNPAAEYKRRSLKKFGPPERTATLVATFDEAGKLKPGEALHYCVEARDTKGQTARTREFVVRIAGDGNGADKDLENFDKTQDTFQDRLAKLIGEQKKIQTELEKANKDHAELTEKVRRQEEAAARPEEKGKPEEKKPEEKKPEINLTPEEKKRLEELRAELDKLAREQERTAEEAKKFGEDLKKAGEEAAKLDLLPKPLAEEMKATERLFDKMVAAAMRDLGRKLTDGADPKKETPDLKGLKNDGERIGKELEGLKDRLDALDKARKGLKEDAEAALAKLREKMLKEDAKVTARDLEELRELINRLREQIKEAGERADTSEPENAEPGDPKKTPGKKGDAEKDLEKLIARAKKLLDKGDRDKPEFPDAPFRDDKEEKGPPREEDTNEPLPNKKLDKKAGDKAGEAADPKDEGEEKFMPRLGGPKPKRDPRFDKKRRPVKKGEKEDGEKEDGEKEGGDARKDADDAERSLESDAKTLESMIEGLKNPGKGKGGKPPEGAEGESDVARQLREMLDSPKTREARLMAAAAKALAQGKGKGKPQNEPHPPGKATEGNLEGAVPAGTTVAGLAKLDPSTRAMILKLPPSRFRDELIQGLSERGPEAYEAFIQDYFKRLTDDKAPPK